jgi:hypothetical protein
MTCSKTWVIAMMCRCEEEAKEVASKNEIFPEGIG